MNFSTNARIDSFQFNNTVINEMSPEGKKFIQAEIKDILGNPTYSINDLSVGIEMTDDNSSHFYDNYRALCRYSVFSHTTVSSSLVFALKGKIVKRVELNLDYLDNVYRELFESYLKRLGIILVDRNSSDWSQKNKSTTLENFVKSISMDPLK